MAINWIFISSGLLYIIPVIALLRYYSIIKNYEYLLTSLVFLFLMVNGIIIGIWGFGNIWEGVTVLFPILLIIVITKRVLGKSYDILYYSILFTCIILAISNFVLIGTSNVELEIYRIIIFETIRLLLGFYIYYAYTKVYLVLENTRTRIVTNVWKFGGIIAFSTALFRITDLVIYLNSTSSTNLDAYAPALHFSLLLIAIGALSLSVLTGITAVLFPELFLLSKFQIKNLYDLYEIAEDLNRKEESKFLPHQTLLDYINSLKDKIEDK